MWPSPFDEHRFCRQSIAQGFCPGRVAIIGLDNLWPPSHDARLHKVLLNNFRLFTYRYNGLFWSNLAIASSQQGCFRRIIGNCSNMQITLIHYCYSQVRNYTAIREAELNRAWNRILFIWRQIILCSPRPQQQEIAKWTTESQCKHEKPMWNRCGFGKIITMKSTLGKRRNEPANELTVAGFSHFRVCG